jgi:hypothetical protein
VACGVFTWFIATCANTSGGHLLVHHPGACLIPIVMISYIKVCKITAIFYNEQVLCQKNAFLAFKSRIRHIIWHEV